MQVVTDGLLTHYTRVGKGKPVLLVHGWADRLETFKLISSDLANDFELISVDLPGFGQTQNPHEPWNLDNYAKFLRAFLIKIDAKPYAIIGHSNGGAVVIRGLSMGELSPSKLVLLASSGVRNTRKLRKIFIKIIAKIGKVLTFWLPSDVRKTLQRKLYGTIGSDMLVAGHMRETFKLTVSQDVLADASAIKIPTLLIYGENDTATSVKEVGAPLQQAITGSRIETIKDADHFVHHSKPVDVSNLTREFLN